MGAINQWSQVGRHDKIFIFGGLMTDKRRNLMNIQELYFSCNSEVGYLSVKTCPFETDYVNVLNLT